MADHDRGGQGSSAFRAFLRALPDDIAAQREEGFPIVLERTSPLTPHAQRLMDSLGVEVRIVTQTARRLQRGEVTDARLALAAQVRELRDTDRLTWREIGDLLEISRSYASELYRDPDGAQSRARKDGYRGACERCGNPTSGSDGRENAPRHCASCAPLVNHETRHWTRERIVEAFIAFAEIAGRAPTVIDRMIFNPTSRERLSPERIAEGEELFELAPLPLPQIVSREFGSWAAALEAAGLEPNPIGGPSHRAPRRVRSWSPRPARREAPPASLNASIFDDVERMLEGLGE